MPLIQDRFEIHDPELHEAIAAIDGSDGVLAEATLEVALLGAHLEAQVRGHDLMVRDRMAHHGKTEWRRVSPNGEVTLTGQKA